MPQLERYRFSLTLAVLIGWLATGCTTSEPSLDTPAYFGEWESTTDLTTLDTPTPIPDGLTLTLRIAETGGRADIAQLSLGCSKYGGPVEDLPSLFSTNPTIQGEGCAPEIEASETALSSLVFQEGSVEVVEGILILKARTLTIEFERA